MKAKKRIFLVLSIFITLFSGEVLAAEKMEKETEYMAILLEGHKIGFVEHTRQVEDGIVTTTEDVTMTIGRAAVALKIHTRETSIETLDGRPLGFEMIQDISNSVQRVFGSVGKDGKVHVTREGDVGGQQNIVIDWPAGAKMAEGMRLAQLKAGLEPGQKIELLLFRPDMVGQGGPSALKAVALVGGKKSIDLFGRVLELTEVTVEMKMGPSTIRTTSFVDAEMNALKTLVPMMGMTLEMVSCDKAFAMREDDVVDFLGRLMVKSPQPITELSSYESVTYTIAPVKDKNQVIIPAGDSQVVKNEQGKFIVTVKPQTAPAGVVFPYKGNNSQALKALEPTEYIQSDDPKIIDFAKHAVGSTKDTAKAAAQIESFAAGYITEKDLSVGYASAAEVAKSRQGDCSEHAILTAAMCRAIGIPARVVCGVLYVDAFAGQQNVFGGHMWVEVFIGDKWYGLDATPGLVKTDEAAVPRGFSVGHIALARGHGAPSDFFSLVNTLGCFTIEKVDVTKKAK